MEEEAIATTTTYWWCHMCSRTVTPPLMEAEIKCPICASGFLEEMPDDEEEEEEEHDHHNSANNNISSLLAELAPILIQQLTNHPSQSLEAETTENEAAGNDDVGSQLQEILRRTPSSVSITQVLLRGRENNGDDGGGDRERSGRVIMVPGVGSLSEYFTGPGFEALLQRLAEDDPNRYGTPPALKEAVESLATVKIQEEDKTLQCSVCLDDFEVGMEAKEMPCEHKFHGDCLLPWLELHSSCPVCRYELPSEDERKTDSDEPNNGNNDGEGSESSSSSSTSSQGSENSHPEQEEEEEEESDDDEIQFSWLIGRLLSSSQGSSSNPSTDT